VHEGNNMALLGIDNTANCTNTNIVDVMIINAFYINSTKITRSSSPATPPFAPWSISDRILTMREHGRRHGIGFEQD
jgi:hypothetical protein